MSHQGGGPRNYVHKDFHNQVVDALKARVAELQTMGDMVAESYQAEQRVSAGLREVLIERDARVAELQGILDAATGDHGTTSGQLREAMDRVSELEDKCKRLEGQPREAWDKRQLVSGCNSMVVDVWFPRSTAHRFDGQCILLPDQSGEGGK